MRSRRGPQPNTEITSMELGSGVGEDPLHQRADVRRSGGKERDATKLHAKRKLLWGFESPWRDSNIHIYIL